MANRAQDWLAQAEHDLRHARRSRITHLLADMEAFVRVSEEVRAAARRLDRHYVPARYPNGFDRGTPSEYYGPEDAGQAIADAETIHRFCRDSIRQPGCGA